MLRGARLGVLQRTPRFRISRPGGLPTPHTHSAKSVQRCAPDLNRLVSSRRSLPSWRRWPPPAGFSSAALYLFGAALNRFFLVYVALFTLFALIFGLANLDVNGISRRFSATTPVKWISGYMVFRAAVLGVAWTAQALSFAVTGQLPQSGLDEGGFKLVAALDLPLVVSGVALAAAWLWRRRPWGYVLATMFNVKGATYTLVLTAGSLYAAGAGVEGAADLVPLWVSLGAASLLAAVLLLRNLQSTE